MQPQLRISISSQKNCPKTKKAGTRPTSLAAAASGNGLSHQGQPSTDNTEHARRSSLVPTRLYHRTPSRETTRCCQHPEQCRVAQSHLRNDFRRPERPFLLSGAVTLVLTTHTVKLRDDHEPSSRKRMQRENVPAAVQFGNCKVDHSRSYFPASFAARC